MKKTVSLLLVLTMLLSLVGVASAATSGQLSDGRNTIELPYDSTEASVYTYTATQTGKLYVSVAELYCDFGDGVYEENKLSECGYYTTLTVNGETLENDYYGTVEVVEGQTYTFSWEHIFSKWYQYGWEAVLYLSYTDDLTGTAAYPVELYAQNCPADSLEIAPGEVVNYILYEFGGALFTVTGENAYVLMGVNGVDVSSQEPVRYDAEDGVVSVAIPYDYIKLQIGNDGTEPAVFKLDYYYALGTALNPQPLVMGENVATVEKDDYNGYYFTWTAPCSGTLTLTFPESGWMGAVENVTAGSGVQWFDYSGENPVAVEVSGGDTLRINITTINAMGMVLGGDVVFTASADTDHSYESGHCQVCGALDMAHLSQAFQSTLRRLDWFYELDAYYMADTVNNLFLGDCDYGEYVTVSADAYEAMVNAYFVLTEEIQQALRSRSDDQLTYNEADHTYTLGNVGGMGGSMAPRAYQGYVFENGVYRVYYGNITYAYLSDLIPNAWEYFEQLGWPATIEYEGVVYEAGPEGYTAVVSYDDFGKLYTVELNGNIVRILSCVEYTAEDLPEAFDDEIVYELPEDNSVVIPDNDCFEDGVNVKVEQIAEGDIFDTAVNTMKWLAESYTVYDFTACKNGAAVQPNGSLTVTFAIPEGYSNNVAVYYMDEDGILEELEAAVDAEARTVTVELEHFSTYILADKDTKPKTLPGDVNGDGKVNARDARAVLRYIAGLLEEGEIDEDAADYNGDGKVNARDARAILRFIAGLN